MGDTARYRCEACGFESDDLCVGFGMMSESFPAVCSAHRGMTAVWREHHGAPSSEPPEKPPEPCDECGAEVEMLAGPPPWKCPVCGDRHLREIPPEMVISWD